MERLPEDCMDQIITSPMEACRMSSVSQASRSIMDSDKMWENFLPSDYKKVLSRLVYPIEYSSKKDLFFKLSNPLLIDKGSKIFWLDKRTGKKCYALGARELSITGYNDPLYWSWKPLAASRFSEAAELRSIWRLEIEGSIKSSALSPKTTYLVYLIVQISNQAFGLHTFPIATTIEIGKHKVQRRMYLCKHNIYEQENICCLKMRGNGMLEIKLGEFYNKGDDDEDVKMSIREMKGVHPKGGLIVEGMDIRAQI